LCAVYSAAAIATRPASAAGIVAAHMLRSVMRDAVGPLLAVVVLIGYFALEVTAARHAGPRMEPTAIFAELSAGHRTAERCGPLTPETLAQGVGNLAVIREQALRKLAKAQPDATDDALARTLDERATAARAKADGLVDAQGCDGKDVHTLRVRFDIHAKTSLR
jgi:hypothetical protein